VHQDGGGRLGREGELGAHRGYQNGAVMPADVQSSNEKFEQPGGSGSEGRRMEKERRARGSYRQGLEGQLLMK
jgi:hypothetical protein